MVRRVLTGVLLIALSACLEARPKAPGAPQDAASVAAGKTLYEVNCVACHGAEGKGDGPGSVALDPKPRDLSSSKYKYGDTDQIVFVSISKGLPGSGMVAWENLLSVKERWQLVAFIKTLRKRGK